MMGLRKGFQSSKESAIALFNISTLDYTLNNGSYSPSIATVPDGSIVFAGFDNSFNAYSYSLGTATFIKKLLTYSAQMITISEDSSLMIAYLNNMRVTVFSIKMTNNSAINSSDETQFSTDPTI